MVSRIGLFMKCWDPPVSVIECVIIRNNIYSFWVENLNTEILGLL